MTELEITGVKTRLPAPKNVPVYETVNWSSYFKGYFHGAITSCLVFTFAATVLHFLR